MAKKRKTTRKKKVEEASEQSAFWPLTGAVVLIVLALLVLLGGFGTGGTLPKGMFNGIYWALGWMAYLVPVAFVYWGVYKFKTEDHRIPRGSLFSMFGLLLFAASLFFALFATKKTTGDPAVQTNIIWLDGHGGEVGKLVGATVLSALDKFPASLIFFVAAVLCACFAFGSSPLVLLKLGKLFTRNPADEDTDLAALKARADGFQLTEGVPVEHHGKNHGSFKNAAAKMAPAEDHAALTAPSDPDWKFPGVELLNQKQDKADPGDVNANAQIIKETFDNFSIEVGMEGANVGPRVTQYTMKPPTGVKLQKITALESNLALDLAAQSIRMEAPIPGKRAVGIEVPNIKPAVVRLSSILQSSEWGKSTSGLTFAIGKDIAGVPVVADLDKMPHLLVAGQTGSGKSVMINDILTSLLYRNSPADLKLILVDPKQVELTPYNDVPHLLTPVITEPEKCISALKWAVAEMERRLRTMAEVGKRNIGEYNDLKKEAGMPYIVIVIDELADLMMMAARDVEALIVRIAQKARAAGIHLILATQRPSVDVITGLIKANVPARIAFTTASQVDSRTIIDQVGAEKLLGRGDMLFLTADMPKPKRVQGALVEEPEIAKVNDFIRMQRPPQYDDEVVSQPVQLNGKGGVVADLGASTEEPIYKDAVRVVVDSGKASTSLLQRRLGLGYGRAAKLIDIMEEQGIISSATGNKPREVLVTSVDEVFGSPSQPASADAELSE